MILLVVEDICAIPSIEFSCCIFEKFGAFGPKAEGDCCKSRRNGKHGFFYLLYCFVINIML